MGIVMYDTVTVSEVPSFANTEKDAVAGYIDGWYNDFSQLEHDFPKAHHLSIAVHPQDDGDALDVEPGDASNSDAAGWVKRQQGRGSKLIILYTSASNVQALINTLAAAGIGRGAYKVWSAHYTYRQHICSPSVCGYPLANGTQWTDHSGGRNLDESYLEDNFFGVPIPPKPVDPYHYLWFTNYNVKVANGRELNERWAVELYDKLRKHPVVNKRRLYYLQRDCRLLADHIAATAYEQLDKDLNPNWKIYHRKWRFDQLLERANGKQLVTK